MFLRVIGEEDELRSVGESVDNSLDEGA